MPRRSKIINMSLPSGLLLQVEEMARRRGVSKSHILREALRDYIASERRWGEETAKKLRIEDEEWGELWEDIYDILVSESRRGEPTVPWEELKAEIRHRHTGRCFQEAHRGQGMIPLSDFFTVGLSV